MCIYYYNIYIYVRWHGVYRAHDMSILLHVVVCLSSTINVYMIMMQRVDYYMCVFVCVCLDVCVCLHNLCLYDKHMHTYIHIQCEPACVCVCAAVWAK